MSQLPPSPSLVINGYALALAGEGIGVYVRRLLNGLLRNLPPEQLRIVIPKPLVSAASWLPAEIIQPVSGRPFSSRKQIFLDLYWASRLGAYSRKHYSQAVFHSPREFYAWTSPRRTVTTIHDCNHWRFASSQGSALRSTWRRATEYFAARRSPLTLTVSQWAKHDLATMAKIPEEKIRVIYNWVDPNLSRAQALQTLAAVRNEYRLPAQYFLYVGGFSANKNIDALLRAYARAGAQRVVPPLVVAGDLAQYQRAQRRDFWEAANAFGVSRDKIVSTGFVPSAHLYPLMAGADVLIYPSKSEGFGYPPVEALALGTPVIVADATSLKEVVPQARCRFDPEQESDLTDKLLIAADDPRQFACALEEKFTEAYGIREYLLAMESVGANFSARHASAAQASASTV